MIIATEKGEQIRGDLIISAVIRTGLVPVPVTFEAQIRTDDALAAQLVEGKVLTVSGDTFRIIKINPVENRVSQGDRNFGGVSLIAFLDNCASIAFKRERAIIKTKTSLMAIYKAAGATFKGFDSDITIPAFSCFVGSTPSFEIARVLQEEGGEVRWKNGKMQFFRYADLFRQKAMLKIPNNASDDVKSGFLERHEVPSFYSLDKNGNVVSGNISKARARLFIPNKNAQQLQNMTRCLVHKKKSKVTLNMNIAGGDVIEVDGASPLVVITAAHVVETGDNGMADQYTKLWLGSLENV
ncbi:hypothetical protein [Methylocucumis oryzae]|uniref:Uncharacterized protein n=1 Tax=Methylocucumis oryzae TaxID=1632867 RepID=A0A0F3IN46_9GAMM|nr:hypothetical protein [Methylocucumis oryzae]KJV08067.1 hypothetical protein VZ94_00465 [Methylocucumis oryzae]